MRAPWELSSRLTSRTANSWEPWPRGSASSARSARTARRCRCQQVAKLTAMTRAAARRFLLTLHALGYVECDGRSYRLAAKTLELGFSFLSSHSWLSIASPLLEFAERRAWRKRFVDRAGRDRRGLCRSFSGEPGDDAGDGHRLAPPGLLHCDGQGAARRAAGAGGPARPRRFGHQALHGADHHRPGRVDGGMPQGAAIGLCDRRPGAGGWPRGCLRAVARCAGRDFGGGQCLRPQLLSQHRGSEARCLPALRDCVARISRSLV